MNWNEMETTSKYLHTHTPKKESWRKNYLVARWDKAHASAVQVQTDRGPMRFECDHVLVSFYHSIARRHRHCYCSLLCFVVINRVRKRLAAKQQFCIFPHTPFCHCLLLVAVRASLKISHAFRAHQSDETYSRVFVRAAKLVLIAYEMQRQW